MATTLEHANRVVIGDKTVRAVQEVGISSDCSLLIQDGEGRTMQLPSNVESMLLGVLKSISEGGEVTIGRVPQELTSTAAAEILGVSRPTLMKWARTGKISSFKVGTHARFKREDVFRLRKQRAEERGRAFEELRRLEWENRDILGE